MIIGLGEWFRRAVWESGLEEYLDKMAGFVFTCLGERLGRDAFESSEGEQTGIGDLEC